MNSEKLNFNIGNFSDKYLSEREQYLRSKSKIKIFTFEEVRDFVMSQSVSDEIKRELLVLLNKYPHAAYNNFIENINKNIQVIMKKRSEYIRQNNPSPQITSNKNNKNLVKEITFDDIDQEATKEVELENSNKSVLDELKEEFN